MVCTARKPCRGLIVGCRQAGPAGAARPSRLNHGLARASTARRSRSADGALGANRQARLAPPVLASTAAMAALGPLPPRWACSRAGRGRPRVAGEQGRWRRGGEASRGGGRGSHAHTGRCAPPDLGLAPPLVAICRDLGLGRRRACGHACLERRVSRLLRAASALRGAREA